MTTAERIKRQEYYYLPNVVEPIFLPLEPEANWHYTKTMSKPVMVQFCQDGHVVEGVAHRKPFVVDVASTNYGCQTGVLTVDKHWLKAKQ